MTTSDTLFTFYGAVPRYDQQCSESRSIVLALAEIALVDYDRPTKAIDVDGVIVLRGNYSLMVRATHAEWGRLWLALARFHAQGVRPRG